MLPPLPPGSTAFGTAVIATVEVVVVGGVVVLVIGTVVVVVVVVNTRPGMAACACVVVVVEFSKKCWSVPPLADLVGEVVGEWTAQPTASRSQGKRERPRQWPPGRPHFAERGASGGCHRPRRNATSGLVSDRMTSQNPMRRVVVPRVGEDAYSGRMTAGPRR